ncbi:hypothetical protein [Chryseobacterium sp. JV558]|uniref:hypothetical protein n=1 Tax=Chryseobacterium sp. JV558 TaxID=2663236 RepID=UPI00299EC2A5|nr:hypothetical protein [Chryseobacterium sp. JV558]MDW9380156.1 hypothetical protein [Chryseobacterium sp. JV558]
MNIEKLRQSIANMHPIENEILDFFLNKDASIELSKPVILESKHAYDVYYDRYMMQSKLNNSNVTGYEILLNNLKKQTDNVEIYQIKTSIGFIACFFNKTETLLGVLWNKNKK